MGIIEGLKTIIKTYSHFGPGGALTVTILVIALLLLTLVKLKYVSAAQLLDDLNLILTGSDVMIGSSFVHFLSRKLKDQDGLLAFYNIPLSTLENSESRDILWAKCLQNNKRLRLFLLLSPAQTKHLLKLSSEDNAVRGILHGMNDRLGIIEVNFPPQERANYGCVLLQAERKPIFVTASFSLPGFWDWELNDFFCFLAFSPTRLGGLASPKTYRMCEKISASVMKIIDAAQTKKGTVEFVYGPDASDHISATLHPQVMTIFQLELRG